MIITLLACLTIENTNVNETIVEIEDGCCGCCESDCCDDGCDTGDPLDSGDTGFEDPCEDFEPTQPEDPVVDEGCLADPDPVDLDPVVEWSWPGEVDHKDTNVMMTPVVAPLTDDDGDGLISSSDIPDVVFTSFEYKHYDQPGHLTSVSGDTGVEHFSVDSVTGADGQTYLIPGAAGVALGDLEGDGLTDICFAGWKVSLVCLEGDGSLKWAAGSTARIYGYPVIADMDGDGSAEVILGRQIYDASGNLLGTGSYGWAGNGTTTATSAVVDIDLDGQLELIVGNAAYDINGNDEWYNPSVPDGPVAIGDFDLDGMPEVVTVASGTVYILDSAGNLLYSWLMVDGTVARGGPPTVADFDGDGVPEIGVAGRDYYAVYEVDGTVLWQTANTDVSSNRTGSSVFDFEGDGVAEVIYADEDQLFVLDGPTGADLMSTNTTGFDATDHGSGTIQEYPSLADTDNDGSTEIVLASNNYADSTDWNGVRAIGSLSSSWMPSRPVWNQHAYSITNIEDDGSVPVSPSPNWTSWNNFRTADMSDNPGDWLPNLYPYEPEYCEEACPSGELQLWIPVGNDGLIGAGSFEVTLLDDGVEVYSETVSSLGSGSSALLGPILVDASMWTGTLEVMVDDDLVVDECDETDNLLSLGQWPCE